MFVSFMKPPESPPPGAAAGQGGAVTGAVAGVMSAGDFLAAKLDESVMALVGAAGSDDDKEARPIVREVDERTAAARKEYAERPPLTFAQRLKRLVAGIAFVAVLVAMYVSATMYQVWKLSSVDDAAEVGAGPYDAIVVLGAAQYNGEPSPVFANRLDRAHELYDDGFSDTIITTGSKQAGDAYTEGYAGFEYLRDQGVPEDAIQVIVDGTNTWEELSATAAVMEGLERTSVLMVSDPYHNYRLARIADEVGLEPHVAPTDTDSTMNDYVRETVANSIGQITGFRRLSNWSENR